MTSVTHLRLPVTRVSPETGVTKHYYLDSNHANLLVGIEWRLGYKTTASP